jgi:hypothetical protein
VPARVGVVEREADIYVARLPDGPIVRLTGTAMVIWRAALMDGEESVTDRVAAALALPADRIAEDVEDFISTLLEQSLLHAQDRERY